MQYLAIVLMSVLAAVVYGVVHDQITVRICLEYFTVGHPRLIDSDSPTVLGFFWGVVATWWVGLPLGIALALCARAGTRPPLGASELVGPLRTLLLVMFGIAALAGLIGWAMGATGTFVVVEPLASRMPVEKHVPFLVCEWAHSASYLVGFVGGVVLCVKTWRKRGPQPTMARQ